MNEINLSRWSPLSGAIFVVLVAADTSVLCGSRAGYPVDGNHQYVAVRSRRDNGVRDARGPQIRDLMAIW